VFSYSSDEEEPNMKSPKGDGSSKESASKKEKRRAKKDSQKANPSKAPSQEDEPGSAKSPPSGMDVDANLYKSAGDTGTSIWAAGPPSNEGEFFEEKTKSNKRTKTGAVKQNQQLASIKQVTAEMLFHHPDNKIRQGALKGYLTKLVSDTQLTKNDLRTVAKELLPLTMIQPQNPMFARESNSTEKTPEKGSKKKNNKGSKDTVARPVPSERAKARKAAIKQIRDDTETYPTHDRGEGSAYAVAIHAIREQYRPVDSES
jgi:hypothetical protein